MVTQPRPQPESLEKAEITSGYANYVLVMMLAAYVFNFIDRYILNTLLQPIKEEFGVSDTAMGILTGTSFALFYAFLGIPIARWADRGVRRTIIALALLVWSGMTALSGAAQSYLQLALIRVGVGVGEAGCSPPAHSLISDYFSPERRGRALSIYAMGTHLGILFGTLVGGHMQEAFGWRLAFLVVGLPGLALAALVRFTVREPPRGATEAAPMGASAPSAAETFRYLWSLRSFVWLMVAMCFIGISGYGFGVWLYTYFLRVHGMGHGQTANWMAFMTVFGAFGTYAGGMLGDRLGSRDPRGYLRVAAWSALASVPFGLTIARDSAAGTAFLLLIPFFLLSVLYVGPGYALVQGLAPLRMRAMAAAIMLFLANLFGLGAGPPVVGALNDWLHPTYGAQAIRYTLALVVLLNIPAALFFALAGRTLVADLKK